MHQAPIKQKGAKVKFKNRRKNTYAKIGKPSQAKYSKHKENKYQQDQYENS